MRRLLLFHDKLEDKLPGVGERHEQKNPKRAHGPGEGSRERPLGRRWNPTGETAEREKENSGKHST